jgi:hypothetical protein
MRWFLALGLIVTGCLADGEHCGRNMHYDASLGVCMCDPDTVADGGSCRVLPGLGAACDAATACDDSYPVCWRSSCTKTCAADTDCPDSYVCADWETTPVCRTFTGFGASCVGPEDCASFDANACLQGHCGVVGCTVGVDDCPRDTKCCDFSALGFGTVCAPAEYCP